MESLRPQLKESFFLFYKLLSQPNKLSQVLKIIVFDYILGHLEDSRAPRTFYKILEKGSGIFQNNARVYKEWFNRPKKDMHSSNED